MRYFSLFSGVGGFELGVEYAFSIRDRKSEKRNGEPDTSLSGIQTAEENILPMQPSSSTLGAGVEREILCVGFSEIDKHASAVLRYRFPNVKNYGDITKINWSEVPDFDLLVGGSPCQDLSVAGKRSGLAGGRSGLFWSYVNALRQKKPQHFIWENVKGALSSNGGRDFANILLAFSEAGYSLWWQVLNAKDFGVPQNRERIFIVGTRNGSPREIFFERESAEEDTRRAGRENSYTIDASYAKGTNTTTKSRRQVVKTEEPKILHQNQSGNVSVHNISVAQGANRSHNYQTLLESSRIRRLTPTECERLMSFPDDWTKYGRKEDGTVYEQSDTQRYKQCGNGVVANVVAELMKAHLLENSLIPLPING